MQDEEGQFVPRRCDFARCRGPTRAVSTPSVCGVDAIADWCLRVDKCVL